MNDVTVSVIVPTYNRGHIVADAIDSVLSQSVSPDEVIVVDDGSTDNTPEVLARFGHRITMIRQSNSGVSAARNAGIVRAKTDWIAFLDSDDLWRPERIASFKRDVQASDAGVHVSNLELTGAGFRRELFQVRGFHSTGPWPLKRADGFDFAMLDPYLTGVAMRRDWLESVGGFDRGIPYCEDVDLLCRMIFLGPWMANSSVTAELRRVAGTEDSLSGRIRKERVIAENIKITTYLKLLESLPSGSSRSHLIRRMISKNWFNAARALSLDGKQSQARENLVRSAREHPTFKGWLRALPPIVAGEWGFDLLDRAKKPGFYRTTK